MIDLWSDSRLLQKQHSNTQPEQLFLSWGQIRIIVEEELEPRLFSPWLSGQSADSSDGALEPPIQNFWPGKAGLFRGMTRVEWAPLRAA